MISGDSSDYHYFDLAVSKLTKPIGMSLELGVRRGQGSKCIIDAYRKHHPQVKLYHLGVDPYGNILYNCDDSDNPMRLDYTEDMKKDMINDFNQLYPEFYFVNLEDKEFFKRYHDYYPIYNFVKTKIDKFEVVHYDGPHDTPSIIEETEYFLNHKPEQCFYIYDDIKNFDLQKIEDHLVKNGFSLIQKGERKAVYEFRT